MNDIPIHFVNLLSIEINFFLLRSLNYDLDDIKVSIRLFETYCAKKKKKKNLDYLKATSRVNI